MALIFNVMHTVTAEIAFGISAVVRAENRICKTPEQIVAFMNEYIRLKDEDRIKNDIQNLINDSEDKIIYTWRSDINNFTPSKYERGFKYIITKLEI